MAIIGADYILPLAVGRKTAHNTVDEIHRYAGCAFYIGTKGKIATCAHICESLADGEILVAKDFNLGLFYEVKDIICHEKMDFAVGRINVHNNRFLYPINEKKTPILVGTDVQAFGFNNSGKYGVDLMLKPRMFKGYISFLGHKPDTSKRCMTLCELSFPSLAGFSGAPVMLANTDKLIGMLYGNNESSIEVFSHSEIEEGGNKYTEKIFRAVEFGLAHTINDIKFFLNELGVEAFK